MKKNLILFLAGCLLATSIMAQITDRKSSKHQAKGMNNAVALGFSFPIGVFNRTHAAGLTLDYSRSNDRYGNDAFAGKLIKFAMNGGVSYHAGKSTTTAGYEFRYGGYFIVYAAAGIDYKPAIPVNISLTAGPVMSMYKGSADIGAGVNLFWNYFLSKNIAVGPGIHYRKQSKADALWSGTIRASYAF
ncbi:MAG: hypothetical protein ABI675_11625 [Chitinophagaceae bacterium]